MLTDTRIPEHETHRLESVGQARWTKSSSATTPSSPVALVDLRVVVADIGDHDVVVVLRGDGVKISGLVGLDNDPVTAFDLFEVGPHGPLQRIVKKPKFDLFGYFEKFVLELPQHFDLVFDLSPVDVGYSPSVGSFGVFPVLKP